MKVRDRACGDFFHTTGILQFFGGKMIKHVFNRHVMVEILDEEEEKETKSFLLPDDYAKPKSPYAIGKVLICSEDGNLELRIGELIVFQRSMVQEIEIKGRKNYLILENYIFGSIDNEVN